ncbi:MAG: hypothetical protein AAGJ95_18380 [Cyanobacteria bacterium J06554_11]
MKFFFSRLSATVAIAAAALLSIPSGAFAQQAPNYNYVGIGGGDDGFAVNGKLSLAENLSIRPEVATDFDFDDGEDLTYLVPITYDFNTIGTGRTAFNPFVGAGVSGDIGDDSDIDFSLVAGTDYRFADKYVANGSVSYSPFADDDEVDFTVGIGYLF